MLEGVLYLCIIYLLSNASYFFLSLYTSIPSLPSALLNQVYDTFGGPVVLLDLRAAKMVAGLLCLLNILTRSSGSGVTLFATQISPYPEFFYQLLQLQLCT